MSEWRLSIFWDNVGDAIMDAINADDPDASDVAYKRPHADWTRQGFHLFRGGMTVKYGPDGTYVLERGGLPEIDLGVDDECEAILQADKVACASRYWPEGAWGC